MSAIRGSVGPWELAFDSAPRGDSGSVHVRISRAGGKQELVEVRWRRDPDGIWLELPSGVSGFDLDGERGDDTRMTYRVSRRNGDEAWAGLAFSRAGEQAATAAAAGAKKGVRIRAQMPGKIIRVLVTEGASVEKDQPLLVMEAMKMENEIRSPQPGKVGKLKAAEGQAVETGAELCVIEPV